LIRSLASLLVLALAMVAAPAFANSNAANTVATTSPPIQVAESQVGGYTITDSTTGAVVDSGIIFGPVDSDGNLIGEMTIDHGEKAVAGVVNPVLTPSPVQEPLGTDAYSGCRTADYYAHSYVAGINIGNFHNVTRWCWYGSRVTSYSRYYYVSHMDGGSDWAGLVANTAYYACYNGNCRAVIKSIYQGKIKYDFTPIGPSTYRYPYVEIRGWYGGGVGVTLRAG
jgi:hypothetical protein